MTSEGLEGFEGSQVNEGNAMFYFVCQWYDRRCGRGRGALVSPLLGHGLMHFFM